MARLKTAWDKLSMNDRALFIKLGLLHGLGGLKDIKDTYNLYSSGGNLVHKYDGELIGLSQQMDTIALPKIVNKNGIEDEALLKYAQTLEQQEQAAINQLKQWLKDWYDLRLPVMGYKRDFTQALKGMVDDGLKVPHETRWRKFFSEHPSDNLPHEYAGAYMGDNWGNSRIIFEESNSPTQPLAVHEFAHAIDHGGGKGSMTHFFTDYTYDQVLDTTKSYYERPTELYARIMELRYLNNLDPSKRDYTIQDLLNMKGWLKLDELKRGGMSDEDIVNALNNWASNNNAFEQADGRYLSALGGPLTHKKSTGGPLYPFSFEKNPFLKTPVVRYDEGGHLYGFGDWLLNLGNTIKTKYLENNEKVDNTVAEVKNYFVTKKDKEQELENRLLSTDGSESIYRYGKTDPELALLNIKSYDTPEEAYYAQKNANYTAELGNEVANMNSWSTIDNYLGNNAGRLLSSGIGTIFPFTIPFLSNLDTKDGTDKISQYYRALSRKVFTPLFGDDKFTGNGTDYISLDNNVIRVSPNTQQSTALFNEYLEEKQPSVYPASEYLKGNVTVIGDKYNIPVNKINLFAGVENGHYKTDSLFNFDPNTTIYPVRNVLSNTPMIHGFEINGMLEEYQPLPMLHRWVTPNGPNDLFQELIEHSEGYDLSSKDKMWSLIPKLSPSTIDHIRNIAQLHLDNDFLDLLTILKDKYPKVNFDKFSNDYIDFYNMLYEVDKDGQLSDYDNSIGRDFLRYADANSKNNSLLKEYINWPFISIMDYISDKTLVLRQELSTEEFAELTNSMDAIRKYTEKQLQYQDSLNAIIPELPTFNQPLSYYFIDASGEKHPISDYHADILDSKMVFGNPNGGRFIGKILDISPKLLEELNLYLSTNPSWLVRPDLGSFELYRLDNPTILLYIAQYHEKMDPLDPNLFVVGTTTPNIIE